MYGDFSRDSFDKAKGYRRVLLQQGRPLTDSDAIEGTAIVCDCLQELGKAVFGWHGTHDDGFKIDSNSNDSNKPMLSAGHYFVDGLMCYSASEKPLETNRLDDDNYHLIYLEVWEQSVNSIEDPNLIEPAMAGVDTSVRSRVCWALKVFADLPQEINPQLQGKLAGRIMRPNLMARRNPEVYATDRGGVCEFQKEASQWSDRLYRVEIHRSGKPFVYTDNVPKNEFATFKWSRENGNAVAAVLNASKNAAPVGKSLEIDSRKFSSSPPIREKAYVELLDYEGRSRNKDRQLVKVASASASRVELESAVQPSEKPDSGQHLAASYNLNESSGYFLRQWDHSATAPSADEKVANRIRTITREGKEERVLQTPILANDGCVLVVSDVWIELENGLQVCFSQSQMNDNDYLASDYWLIRVTSDGQVFLTGENAKDGRTEPFNSHHYAPIGTIKKGERPTSKYRQCINNLTKDYESQTTNASAPIITPQTSEGSNAGESKAHPASFPSSNREVVMPIVQVKPASILSNVGQRALRGLLASPKDITRRVPARYLSYEPKSAAYRRFRSALLASEIREPTFEQYLAKVLRTTRVDDTELPIVEADARADYELAASFEQLVSSGGGVQQMFA